MRIIAGSLRSRSLQAPPGLSTRPTSDRLRETLFNVLAPRIEGAAFLDLYAGSGAVGIEAVSRGAERVVLVERAGPALKVLRSNLAKLGLGEGIDVIAENVNTFLRRENAGGGFDLIFLDPPYDAEAEYEFTLRFLGGVESHPRSPNARDRGHPRDLAHAHSLLRFGALVIAEHRRKDQLNARYGALTRTRLLQQGDAALSFYAIAATDSQSQENIE